MVKAYQHKESEYTKLKQKQIMKKKSIFRKKAFLSLRKLKEKTTVKNKQACQLPFEFLLQLNKRSKLI